MNWAFLLLSDLAPIPPVPPTIPEQPVPLPPPVGPAFGLQVPQPTSAALAGFALCLAVFLTVRLSLRGRKPRAATALALGATAPVLLATILLAAWSHRVWSAWQAIRDQQVAAFQAQTAEFDRLSDLHAEAVRDYEVERRRGRGSHSYGPDDFWPEPVDGEDLELPASEAGPAIAPDPDPQ